MELTKTKYKQTEVGLIPEDWKISSLGDAATLKARIGWQGLTTSEYLETGDFFLISGTDFKNGLIDWKNCVFVKKKRYDQDKNIQIQLGDVLVTKDGTIGKVAYVDKVLKPTTLNSGVFVIRSKREVFDSNYFYYVLTSNYFDDFLSKLTAGSTILHLYQKDFVHFKFLLPTLPEQKAIAEVLSDVDSLLQALEQKLAKKRAIKQGAMQKLLTPKEDWEEKKLGEIGKTFGGLSGKTKSDFSNGNSKYIPFMNIMSNPVIDITYLDSVFIKPNESQNKALQGDLFFNGSSETPEEVGLCSVLLKNISNLYLNSFCFGFRLFSQDEISGLYLAYFFRSDEGRKLFYSLAQGATRYNLSKSNFLKLEFPIPSFEKQVKIATIFSDMDKEIELIEKQLSKYKTIKQGLMQELLTGRIRLTV